MSSHKSNCPTDFLRSPSRGQSTSSWEARRRGRARWSSSKRLHNHRLWWMRGIVNQLIDGLLYFSALHATTNVKITPPLLFQSLQWPSPRITPTTTRTGRHTGETLCSDLFTSMVKVSIVSPQISSMLWLGNYAGVVVEVDGYRYFQLTANVKLAV